MGANWSESRPDDLIGPDIDPVGDHDDLRATGRPESTDSGVSLKSDQSKAGMILFEDSSPLSRSDFLSFEEDVVSDEDWIKSLDDLMTKRNKLSIESFDSGVSFKSNLSKDGLIDFKEGVSPREGMNQELSSEVGWKHG